MDKNDGGTAFPKEPFSRPSLTWFSYGMTLRDYFAAAAMQGMLASRLDPDPMQMGDKWATLAYRLADTMIEESAK